MREPRRGNGIGVAVSLAAHFGILTLLWFRYSAPIEVQQPRLRYVQLMNQARTFTEAPGPRVETAPPNAAFSDANRRATTPRPMGTEPTSRPGPADLPFVPGNPGPPTQASVMPTPQIPQSSGATVSSSGSGETFQYRVHSSESPVDWRNAIKEVGRVASLGGDLGVAGGEEGFAESGPVSFETQWYEWGEYSLGMVARIRHHWYANMPDVVRLGLKGVVTIRFTIQRNGTVTNIEMLSSSGTPPYDFAARKAIELASPLAPLPADFPNQTERVTAQFYYNQRPPKDR